FTAARRRFGCAVFVSDLARPRSKAILEWLDQDAASLPAPLRRDLYASLRAAFTYRELSVAIEVAGGSRWRRGRVPPPGEVQWPWAPRLGRGLCSPAFGLSPPRDHVRAVRAFERDLFSRLPHVLLGR